MDYYSTLGVTKNASQDDIRRAYKKMSMQHHPDRGGNEEQFKKINEAYSTLKDPQKRAEYDNPQQYRFNSNDFHGRSPFEDIFRSGPFGFGQQRQPPRRKNKDVRLSYTLDLIDCFNGRGISLQYRIPSGRTELLDIRVPAGAKPGDMIRFEGYGDDSIKGLPRGDLILKLNVRLPKDWAIQGLDLHSTQTVSVFDLLTGCEILLTTPEEKLISLKIPKGTQSGTTFSMNGYGLPETRSGRRGKVYIKVIGKVPKIEDTETLEKLQEIKNNIDNQSS